MTKRICTCERETCRLCWLFHHDPAYAKLWGGLETVKPIRPAHAKKRVSLQQFIPCIHEGNVIEWANCNSEWKHVRDCSLHDRCTRGMSKIRFCLQCPDYVPAKTP